jgi:hypothetical protein
MLLSDYLILQYIYHESPRGFIRNVFNVYVRIWVSTVSYYNAGKIPYNPTRRFTVGFDLN